MAHTLLGKPGQVVTWLTYVLLLYSLMAAYLSGGGAIVTSSINSVWHTHLGELWGPVPWMLIVGGIIYIGVANVDRFNRLLMLGLIVAYVLLVIIAAPHIHAKNFYHHNSKQLFWALPVVITSFGYHVIIPSLRGYLKSDTGRLKKIIFFGSLLPLLTYLVWEIIVFGLIPLQGPGGLIAIFHAGQPANMLTQSIAQFTASGVVIWAAKAFVFFAIASSFLGIAFSLPDFVADGFSIKKTPIGRIFIIALTFIPPFVFVWLFPKGFILALSFAGVFVAILHGFLPALMAYKARQKGLATYKAPGGNVMLILIAMFSALIIVSQILLRMVH